MTKNSQVDVSSSVTLICSLQSFINLLWSVLVGDGSVRPPGVPGVGMTVVSVIIAFYDANFMRRM